MAGMNIAAYRDWALGRYRDINDPPVFKSRFDISFAESFAGKTYTITNGTYTYTGTVPEELEVEVEVAGLETTYIISIDSYSFTETISIGAYYLNVKIQIQKYEYVTNNLIFYYDAINNTGDGHDDSATTWADLSGNDNNGAISNGTWENNALVFNGSSSNVKCGMRNYTNVSIEIYCTCDTTSNSIQHIAGNYYYGGYGLQLNTKIPRFYVGRFNNSDLYVAGKTVQPNEYKHYVGTYDGSEIKLYINGELFDELNTSGDFQRTKDNIFALGARPNGSNVDGYYFNGKIRSFRLYDRALTPNEVLNNYIYELKKYS